ncbi:MAG: serine/threonine-protein kinase [Acidobacteriota bacterium]
MSGGRIDYGTAVPLSSGGAGEVYKAYDAKLGRHVALKFLRSDDPVQVRRLAREARAQANLPAHPNLCAIYGVGTLDGRPYIAMEYVEGEGLDAVGGTLSVEMRVRAIADVAAALEVVHAAGLVHRDIKPENIVLAHGADGLARSADGLARDADTDTGTEAGTMRPVLVDFGTVWSADYRTMTQLGYFIGTPAFMAPEQVRGGHEALGPAADIYALGATLYGLLIGVPPFDDPDPIHLLHQVLNDDAPRLRSRWRSAPRELEAIIACCLAKEPARRYASASDLAADLRSYLAGQSVQAQAQRWDTRIAQRVRGWRRPLQVVAVALALTAVVLGVLGWRAQQRRAAVQRYDPIGAGFEGTLRAEYMSPQHDVRPAQARVRARVRALETALADAPGPARAPMRGAIGRGWLALGETDHGLHHLRAAWADGHRTPAIAYAIGRGLSTRYAAALGQSQRLLDPSDQQAQQAEAVRRYREPARLFLERGRDAPSTAASFVEALLLLYEGDYDAALRQAERARGALPWQHEVDALIGTIYQERSRVGSRRGDLSTSWRDLRAADQAHRRALRSAPGDPHLAVALCAQRAHAFAYAVSNTAALAAVSHPSVVAAHDAARVACYRARRLARHNPRVPTALANVALYWASYRRWITGKDNHAALYRGWQWGQHALDLDPSYAPAYGWLSALALTFADRIDDLQVHYDARPWLDLAEVYVARSVKAGNDARSVLAHWSLILNKRGFVELQLGRDPYDTLRRAVFYAEQVVQRDPRRVVAHYRLAETHSLLAQAGLYFGRSIDASLAASTHGFRRIRRLSSSQNALAQYIALNHYYGAQQAFYRGADHRPWIEHAVQQINRLLARVPALHHVHNYRAIFLLGSARMNVEMGIDPAPMLRRAATSLRAMESASTASAGGGALFYKRSTERLTVEQNAIEALWRRAQGAPIDDQLATIDRWLGDGHDLPLHLVPVCADAAALFMRRALARRSAQAVARADRRYARCIDALARYPDASGSAMLSLNRGKAALLRAYAVGADVAKRGAHLAEAERHWRTAETSNPWLARQLVPLRREVRTLAAARDGHAVQIMPVQR